MRPTREGEARWVGAVDGHHVELGFSKVALCDEALEIAERWLTEPKLAARIPTLKSTVSEDNVEKLMIPLWARRDYRAIDERAVTKEQSSRRTLDGDVALFEGAIKYLCGKSRIAPDKAHI